MIPEEIMKKMIQTLQDAQRQGQPVAELAAAIRHGAELDVRVENGENGSWLVVLSAQTTKQRQG